MNEQPKANASSQFLKTDGGKTKSNAIEIPSVSLPKGGGAIKGIDEKFSVNAVNGTASCSVPLPFSPARGVSPALSLSYNSGAGNGPFGLGWSMNLPSIKRSAQNKLPQYQDESDSDSFLFSEAEDLVPEFKKEPGGNFITDPNGDYIISEKNSSDGLFVIRFYRPRIEGLFARIERWTEKNSGISKWRMITPDNITTLFGWSSNAVISDPANIARICEWLPEFVFDDRGNCSTYIYRKEDSAGISNSLHNTNRVVNGNLTYTNLYLEKVLYGNKSPYKKFGNPFPESNDYMFETVFDYGEYDSNAPFAKINEWEYRNDAFSDYKSGFEIRTTRLCKRVLLFHHFMELPGGSALTRSLNFEYDTDAEPDFTFLKSIRSTGYIKKADGTYTSKSLPAIEYEYQKHEWNKEVKTINLENLVHAPVGIDEQYYQFTDLYNEGLPGILSEQANSWHYKHNLGTGNFGHAVLVSPKPSFSGLGTKLHLADLDADGGKQIVSYNRGYQGFFELDDDNEWQRLKTFQNMPNINFGDANIRMIDLNGDGRAEILVSEEDVFSWYPSKGREGFSSSITTPKSYDQESGPHIVFADTTQSIFVADMSGDGMADIVRIRNGEICYWPNLGYGKFGSKISMDNAPIFDFPDQFNPRYIQLADIDGSGTTDIIYLGKNTFTCWMNLSGNTFSSVPFIIDAFPDINKQSKISVIDLLGTGVSCIVWSGSLSKDSHAPIKYIDLMNSRKPHIMVSYKNNLGKEVSFEYSPSTKFYIDDKLAGKPWITKLPFPVHCISRTEIRDRISGHRFVNSYTYHHGYYDHAEREFRGFGMVEQTDTEYFEHWEKGTASNIVDKELHQQPVLTKSWYHTGAFLRNNQILDQFKNEYWYEELNRQGFDTLHHEIPLSDAHIIPGAGIPETLIEKLSADEWSEALRSCKGMALRLELFAKDVPTDDATQDEMRKQLIPYTVATHNCVIEIIQPKGKNEHAVFRIQERESISYSYERNPEDPKIAHNLNIKMDEYGNVLESAAIVYPRILPDTTLPFETREDQNKTLIIYSVNSFTNDVIDDEAYRLRLPSETKTFELNGISQMDSVFSISDFENILTLSNEVPYHQFDLTPTPGTPQKRLIEHVRTNYYNNDLTGPLALHQLHSLAMPFESYQLAYTPELLFDIFADKVNPDLMTEGGFIHSEGDNNWWIRSGTTQFLDNPETNLDAQNRFYLPLSYTDPFGSKTKIKYYSNYFLFINETEDALGNRSIVDVINFRTLSPQRIRNANNNLSEVLTDELGFVKALALMGKDNNNDGVGEEADDLTGITDSTNATEASLINNFFNAADSVQLTALGKNLLQHATTYFAYDFDVYKNTGKPTVISSVIREEHLRKNNDSPVQLRFEYSNGSGSVIMKKIQAEPGIAKKTVISLDDTYTITDEDTSVMVPKQLRWIGNGRTILNNKGNVVKQYEPYFSVTYQYEDHKELVETGVTPIMFYDAMGRIIQIQMPDGTLNRTVFDSWKQLIYDANDTILESSWYHNRTNRLIDAELMAEGKDPAKEKIAADKSALHANTPAVLHFDTLGRPVLSIEHNKDIVSESDVFHRTKIILDIEGNLRSVFDARELPENSNKGNNVMQYKYDMLGNLIYQHSMDAGQRRLLINILGSPLRTWDERNHEFQYFYDELHRPVQRRVIGGDGSIPLDNIFDRIIYGERFLLPDRSNESELQRINILGRPVKHFDTGGLVDTPAYDFKGQPLAVTRSLYKNYQGVADWTDTNMDADLENEKFTYATVTDALGRITRQTAPDGSVIIPTYNEAGLLKGNSVEHIDPVATITYIKDIEYNEKRHRSKIIYGNDVITTFYYDKKTFRLNRLETKRHNNDPLQDWHYTFDPAGNITHIEDKNIPVAFFNNQKITSVSEYTYDALYRLIEATGRENNTALSFSNKDNWNDSDYMHQLNAGDPMLVHNYSERYQYDEVGNIKQMNHQADGNNWVRSYEYELLNNRLKNTKVGQGASSFTYQYPHHSLHGYITEMPHLEDMGWNFKEELIRTVRQKVNSGNGTPETTFYQYDGGGQRIRKITLNNAGADAVATIKEERIYIDGYETYRSYKSNSINFERETLSLMDGDHRFVTVDTIKQNTDTSLIPSQAAGFRLVRYQLHNHLGSASLELDGTAEVISYEEYHPFGTTAYQANSSAIKAAAKRYRFTGMERDEETGLEYHSARYYLPWLGRWLSADPIGISDGANLYGYCHGNPLRLNDKSGNDAQDKITDIQLVENGGKGYDPNDADDPSATTHEQVISELGGWDKAESLTDFEHSILAARLGSNSDIEGDPNGLKIGTGPVFTTFGKKITADQLRKAQVLKYKVNGADESAWVTKEGYGYVVWSREGKLLNAVYSGEGYSMEPGLLASLINPIDLLSGAAATKIFAKGGTALASKILVGEGSQAASAGVRRSWLKFWTDKGGVTSASSKGAPYTGNLSWANYLGLRQGYNTTIQNFDLLGGSKLPGILDTGVHEGFHALVGRYLPTVWDIGNLTLGKIPIGAPVKYLEEVAAYSLGHLGALRLHGLPLAPIEAFFSMSSKEVAFTLSTGLIGSGGYLWYRYKSK